MGGGTAVYSQISISSVTARFVHSLSVVGVNVYVLISSYFLVNESFKLSKVIHIVLETWFYSWGILLIFKLAGLEIVSMKDSLLPISFAQNWFVTEYIGMYLLFPFCNLLIRKMNEKQHKMIIIVMLALLSIWSDIVPSADPFGVSPGATTFWFIALYMLGSYIRLYVDVTKLKKNALITYLACSILITLSWVLLTLVASKIPAILRVLDYYYRYNCILVVISSVALFILFLSVRIKNKAVTFVIKYFAPLTLGVYLIHDNPNMRNIIWGKLFLRDSLFSSPLLIVQILGRIVCIFLICSLIDFFRSLLFKVFESSSGYKRLMNRINMKLKID